MSSQQPPFLSVPAMSDPRDGSGPSGPPRPSIPSRHRTALLTGLVLAALLAGGLLLAHFPPERHVFYPRCSLHSWTGLHCPGCGSLRALHALTQGDVTGAMKSNLLLTAGAPVLLLVLATRWWRRRDLGLADGIPEWVWWFALALVFVFGLVRNLPGGAFRWLGP